MPGQAREQAAGGPYPNAGPGHDDVRCNSLGKSQQPVAAEQERWSAWPRGLGWRLTIMPVN